MLISHKTKIYPNNKQYTMLNKTVGTNRYAYNYALNLWNKEYEDFLSKKIDKKPNKLSIKKQVNKKKYKDFPFCKEVSKFAVESAILDLAKGFNNFYKGMGKHPVFHKKGANDSFRICFSGAIKIKNKKVLIPKIGYVKMAENVRFEGQLKEATFSKKGDKYYVSFAIDTDKSFKQNKNNNAVGIDLGVNDFVLSNGEKHKLPKSYYKHQRELKRRQQALSRKQKQSKNRNKTKVKVQKIHVKITNLRNDFLNKLSYEICSTYKLISIENLKVKNMSKNHYLAKSILDSSFFEFKRQLEYKSKLYGNKLFINDTYFPSSKMCSVCRAKTKQLTGIHTLSKRKWKCEHCGSMNDRDINASINLVNNAVSSTVSACGEFYRPCLPDGYQVKQASFKKQEENSILLK
jgi:putative transposase